MDIFEQMISEYAWLKLHIDKRAKNPDEVYMSGQVRVLTTWFDYNKNKQGLTWLTCTKFSRQQDLDLTRRVFLDASASQ